MLHCLSKSLLQRISNGFTPATISLARVLEGHRSPSRHGNARAFCMKELGRRQPDAAGSSGHERDLSR